MSSDTHHHSMSTTDRFVMRSIVDAAHDAPRTRGANSP
jgi:hypothetical protein